MNNLINIFLLSLLAGLATGIGGLIAVIRKPGKRSFGFLMGFAAGVMVTLSFTELVNEAWESSGYLVTTIGFGIGALFMFSIDFLTPHMRFGKKEKNVFDSALLKTGMLMAIGITIHNIPEGIAVGAGYMHMPKFGLFIAFAIALHNIPEGIATALPLCKGGVCKWKSFKIALLSGLVEPIGALAAALFLASLKDFVPSVIPASLAFAAGVMVFLTLDELIPTAMNHGHQHFTAIGIISGAIFVFLLSGIFGV
ncbi:ZIP family metal transporter [Candidatus Woesearchaeota archaeon]|nr:ZIP family metal transporter [Candidatus Woesearchaeota archaeon]